MRDEDVDRGEQDRASKRRQNGFAPASWLATHNPFYFIGTFLFLFGIRRAYGEIDADSIDCVLVATTLTAFAASLGAFGVVLVRFGRVWDDARSIFLSILLVLLATSVVGDDLLMDGPAVGGPLVLACGVFAALLSEAIFRLAPIAMPAAFRVPYHLFLAFYFVTPFGLSRVIGFDGGDWTGGALLGLSVVTGFMTLTLAPAMRGGRRLVTSAAHPWRWPRFPMSIFVLLIGGSAVRIYVLTLIYDGDGPIWEVGPDARAAVLVPPTVWAPYFLIPTALAAAWLAVESGSANGKSGRSRLVLAVAAGLLCLTPRSMTGEVASGLHTSLTEAVGSPTWLTLLALVAFYGVAWVRGVPSAGGWLLAAGLAFLVIGPETVGIGSLRDPGPVSWAVAFAATAGLAAWRRRVSPWVAATAVGLGLLAETLDRSGLGSWKLPLLTHAAWAATLAIGWAFPTDLGRLLRACGAVAGPAFVFAVWREYDGGDAPWVTASYAVVVASAFGLIAWAGRDGLYLGMALLVCGLGVGDGAIRLYRLVERMLGTVATAALFWSFASIVLGGLISSAKANWFASRPTGSATRGNLERAAD